MKFFSIVRMTFPILFGYVPLGIAFGLFAVLTGFPWYYAILMSACIYAGSVEFLVVIMLSSFSSLLQIFIAVFLVNFRHFFYGLSMINEFKVIKGFAKKYCIFGLTDETFALLKLVEVDNENKAKVFTIVTALNQFYWVFGVFIGSYFGSYINLDFEGIEFILTALFVVLSIELYNKIRSKKAFILSAVIGCVCMFAIPSSYMLMVALLLCAFSLIYLQRWIRHE